MRPQFNMHYLPLALLYLLLLPLANSYAAGETTRVSVDSAGQQANNRSNLPSISADGRYVVFDSFASKLVPGDTNHAGDVFIHDRQTYETTRVSVNSAGGQGNEYSRDPSISADGRYVVFDSLASNLVPGDTNKSIDVFVHDLITGETTRVSVQSDGGQARENWGSGGPAISSDGRYVAFISWADNLVQGDTNAMSDIFVHDRLTGKTGRVSVDSAGVQGNNLSVFDPAISADGRYVTFTSAADNLVPGDTNQFNDVFVHDRTTNITTRVSVSSKGVQGNDSSDSASISADGRYVAFFSYANNLVPGDTCCGNAFVHDRQTHETVLISVNSEGEPGNNYSFDPSISADGHYVAFWSHADNLVARDINKAVDVFVHNRTTGKTARVNVDSAGVVGNNWSSHPSISADGRYVVFDSLASNLVPGDTNKASDIFVRDRRLNTTQNADLQVSVTSRPDSVQNGDVGRYLFTITNNGPENAGSVNLIDTTSAGKVWSLIPSQGDCKIAAISVCRLGSLAVGASATVRTVYKAKGNPLNQNVTVNAAPLDNNSDNNRVTVSTPVTP